MNELLESLSKLIDVPATELEKVFTTLNLDYSEVIETLIHEASIYNALNPIRCAFNGVAIGMFAFFAFEVIFSFVEEEKKRKNMMYLLMNHLKITQFTQVLLLQLLQ